MTHWWDGKTPPKFYSFHPDTHELVGHGDCTPSPLEPDEWHVPGSATLTAPVPLEDHQAAVWRVTDKGSYWEIVPDYRGEIRWLNGDFWTITGLGEPVVEPLKVHDAQYQLPLEGTNTATIRMWINDDIIEFADDLNLLSRQVLAAWEKQGETIRPVDFESEIIEPDRPDPEGEKRRLDQLASDLDKLARMGVEGGNPVPQETDLAQ